jgi:hypothetical protein
MGKVGETLGRQKNEVHGYAYLQVLLPRHPCVHQEEVFAHLILHPVVVFGDVVLAIGY